MLTRTRIIVYFLLLLFGGCNENIPPNLTDITGLIFRKKTGFRLATVCLINLRWQQLPQLNLIQTQKPKLAGSIFVIPNIMQKFIFPTKK